MNEDARTLPAAAQEEKRKQAIRLRKQGHSYLAISRLVGVHEQTVGKWIRAYSAEGLSAIKAQNRGRKPGTGRFLTNDQEKRIQQVIMDKTPDQLKLAYALWTRKAVQEVIEQRG